MASKTIEKLNTDYLRQHSVDRKWMLEWKHDNDIDQAVVIPVRAELQYLFRTLSSLADNPGPCLARTLVVCVVNNREKDLGNEELLSNNRVTLEYLKALSGGQAPSLRHDDAELEKTMSRIITNRLQIAYIDASSAGVALPDRDGVGLARKIGMDRVLEVSCKKKGPPPLLICLDADTLVDNRYLPAIGHFFSATDAIAAVIPFAHQDPENDSILEAITRYEIFFRYYVLGLKHAGSPYAFHTVGSTIACTAPAYVAVRGMSLRQAGEDFYFLNKLAKTGRIGHINHTRVHPSGRPSDRVPFGTGPSVLKHLHHPNDRCMVYHPDIFDMIKIFLDAFNNNPWWDETEILFQAAKIHLELAAFLNTQHFGSVWPRIKSNTNASSILERQFHAWFDGFKTLKLIHHMTKHGFPRQEMFSSVNTLLKKMDVEIEENVMPASLPKQVRLLENLRLLEQSMQ